MFLISLLVYSYNTVQINSGKEEFKVPGSETTLRFDKLEGLLALLLKWDMAKLFKPLIEIGCREIKSLPVVLKNEVELDKLQLRPVLLQRFSERVEQLTHTGTKLRSTAVIFKSPILL